MIEIKNLETVNNPNSIHGIYPYRGKISAVDAAMVISQFEKGKKLLDPFCGSGTIVYEGQSFGLQSFGVDANPIAVTLSTGKVSIDKTLDDYFNELERLIEYSKDFETNDCVCDYARSLFHPSTLEQVIKLSKMYDSMSPYIKACFLGAICLAARGCNDYKWTSSTGGKNIEPKRDINFYEKFRGKIKKHYYPISLGGKIFYHDSRRLSEVIEENSIDYVFSSPPYFDCLDYTMYYAKIIYDILGVDRVAIKNTLIQNFTSYKEDMQIVLEELYKVCKKGARIIFVVGDKKIHNKVINGGEFFNSISPFTCENVVERSYTGTSSQVFDSINKTERKEQIIIWKK
jgi:SAM-dependent methyltransferase